MYINYTPIKIFKKKEVIYDVERETLILKAKFLGRRKGTRFLAKVEVLASIGGRVFLGKIK